MGSTKKATATAYSVRVTDEAEKNKNEIIGFISFVRNQTLNAVRIADALQRKFVRIGCNPWAFKECEEIPTKNRMYRKASCYSWFIVYKISGTVVIILGIIHQACKPSKIRSLKRRK